MNNFIVDKIKKKCEEEIEWAQANMDEMELPRNPHNYQDDDKVWLPCWLKVHAEILQSITGLKRGEKSDDRRDNVSGSLPEFNNVVDRMMGLYKAGRYIQAEELRDEIGQRLDAIMRLGGWVA